MPCILVRTCPTALCVSNGIVHHRWDRRLHDAEPHVLSYGLGSREAQQTLWPAKAAIAGMFAPAERQTLIQVRNAKAVIS